MRGCSEWWLCSVVALSGATANFMCVSLFVWVCTCIAWCSLDLVCSANTNQSCIHVMTAHICTYKYGCACVVIFFAWLKLLRLRSSGVIDRSLSLMMSQTFKTVCKGFTQLFTCNTMVTSSIYVCMYVKRRVRRPS